MATTPHLEMTCSDDLFRRPAREHPGGLADVQAEIWGHFQHKMKVGLSFLCDGTHFSPWVLLSLDAKARL